MLAYVGPESIAPVLSAVAAFFGFLLIGWRWTFTQCRRVYRFVFRIKDDGPRDPTDDSTDVLQKNEPQPLQEKSS